MIPYFFFFFRPHFLCFFSLIFQGEPGLRANASLVTPGHGSISSDRPHCWEHRYGNSCSRESGGMAVPVWFPCLVNVFPTYLHNLSSRPAVLAAGRAVLRGRASTVGMLSPLPAGCASSILIPAQSQQMFSPQDTAKTPAWPHLNHKPQHIHVGLE